MSQIVNEPQDDFRSERRKKSEQRKCMQLGLESLLSSAVGFVRFQLFRRDNIAKKKRLKMLKPNRIVA